MYAIYRLSQMFLQVELWIFMCLIAAAYLALRRRFLPSRRLLLLGLLLIYLMGLTPYRQGAHRSSGDSLSPAGSRTGSFR